MCKFHKKESKRQNLHTGLMINKKLQKVLKRFLEINKRFRKVFKRVPGIHGEFPEIPRDWIALVWGMGRGGEQRVRAPLVGIGHF